MKTVEVKCDGCGYDLTTRTNMEDYRLVLASESKPGYGAGVYTCMAVYPPIDRQHHFCSLACLDHWRDREKHYSKLRSARLDEWQDKHGTKIDGRVHSYPCPLEDILAAWDSECRAAALNAFPFLRPRRQ